MQVQNARFPVRLAALAGAKTPKSVHRRGSGPGGRYYGPQDALIPNALEIVEVPELACPAAEDLADSAERLAEVVDGIV